MVAILQYSFFKKQIWCKLGAYRFTMVKGLFCKFSNKNEISPCWVDVGFFQVEGHGVPNGDKNSLLFCRGWGQKDVRELFVLVVGSIAGWEMSLLNAEDMSLEFKRLSPDRGSFGRVVEAIYIERNYVKSHMCEVSEGADSTLDVVVRGLLQQVSCRRQSRVDFLFPFWW